MGLLFQSAVAGQSTVPSLVLAISVEVTKSGMYAPFTPAGALVVDGVVASNYGTPSSRMRLPHGAAHAAFFLLRVYHNLSFPSLSAPFGLARAGAEAMLHPFMKMMV